MCRAPTWALETRTHHSSHARTLHRSPPRGSHLFGRHIGGLTGLDIKYGLSTEVAKQDLEEMTTTADRYSGRSASIVSAGGAMRGRY